MEQLAYAQRAGTSLEKLRSMGLAGFVEPLDPVTEPANEKGQDNLDDDDDLRAYVSRITAAALSRAGLDSANEGEPEPAADDAETDEESDEE